MKRQLYTLKNDFSHLFGEETINSVYIDLQDILKLSNVVKKGYVYFKNVYLYCEILWGKSSFFVFLSVFRSQRNPDTVENHSY